MDPDVPRFICSGVFEVDAFSAAVLTRIGGIAGRSQPCSTTDDERQLQCVQLNSLGMRRISWSWNDEW
jgi:hypothetical protein